MPELSKVVAALPPTTPFMPPEAIERQMGKAFKLRLGANESSFGPPPLAMEAIERTIPRIWHYCDGTCWGLRSALAAHLGIAYENVAVGPGIDGILGHIAKMYVDPGEVAVTSLGSYPTFEYAVSGVGGNLVRVPYVDFAPDLVGLSEAAMANEAKVVYLANPDNPSGAWHSPDAIRGFISRLPERSLILLDEAYSEFAPESMPAGELLDDPRVIRLRTFSKLYGMAGMRVAYAIGHADTVEPIHRIRMHFEVNILGQAAAEASLKDNEHVERVLTETRLGRQEYATLAESLGMRALPSSTNFVAIDVGSHERAVSLLQALAAEGVFIRMPWAPPLNSCIRVTVGRSSEREDFGEALRAVVSRGL